MVDKFDGTGARKLHVEMHEDYAGKLPPGTSVFPDTLPEIDPEAPVGVADNAMGLPPENQALVGGQDWAETPQAPKKLAIKNNPGLVNNYPPLVITPQAPENLAIKNNPGLVNNYPPPDVEDYTVRTADQLRQIRELSPLPFSDRAKDAVETRLFPLMDALAIKVKDALAGYLHKRKLKQAAASTPQTVPGIDDQQQENSVPYQESESIDQIIERKAIQVAKSCYAQILQQMDLNFDAAIKTDPRLDRDKLANQISSQFAYECQTKLIPYLDELATSPNFEPPEPRFDHIPTVQLLLSDMLNEFAVLRRNNDGVLEMNPKNNQHDDAKKMLLYLADYLYARLDNFGFAD